MNFVKAFLRAKKAPKSTRQSGRHYEAGDTLVEILVSLTVLAIAGLAILLAFATSITGSSDHRNLATMDTMLRTAAAEVTAAIQQQPSSDFSNCSGAYTLNSTPNSIPLPTAGYTATIQYAQYWTGTNWTPTSAPSNGGCPSGVVLVGTSPNIYPLGPQQLTVQVTYKGSSDTITTVVQDPSAPGGGVTSCGDATTQLVWVAQPGSGLAGSALTPAPTLVLEDGNDCVEKSDASTVSLSIASGPPGAPLNNCSAFPGSGETTFEDCSLDVPGTYTLQASDPTDGVNSVVSNQFVITPGSPAKLVFHDEPANGTGGTPFATTAQPVQVWVEDSSGNVISGDNSTVSLAIGTNPSGGTLSGCGSAAAINGVATFTGCKIDKAGNGYTLTATDSADGLTNPTVSTTFNITVGPAAQLAFKTSPGSSIAGEAFGTQPVVLIEDLGGNTVTSNTSTVALAIGTNPGGGTLSGCRETTTAGVATFSGCAISANGIGYTVIASDGTLTPATSIAFNITAPTLTSFSVVPSTTTPTAGSVFTVKITALDQGGGTFTGLTGNQTIVFSGPASSPTGTPPLYGAPVTFTNGVASAASVTLYDAQTTTLTAALTTVQGTISGTSGNIIVSAAAAKTLRVSGFPNPTVAGAKGSVTVTANDSYGNVATSYRGTVKLTSSDAKAGLPNNYAFTAGNVGVETFTNGVTLNTAGTQSITATDTNTPSITGGQTGIVVNKASPSIATTLSPSAIAIGQAAHDTSSFTGLVNSTGTGTVTYSYYSDNACTTNPVTVNTVTVSTAGTVPNSNTVTFTNVGAYYWQAVYSGDANNNAVSSPCTATNNEQLTVGKASPTLTTALSSGTITIGGTANDTATLSGVVNSSGLATVVYSYYANNTCTTGAATVSTVVVSTAGAVPNSSSVTFDTAGTYYWQALYNGDANNNGATSPCTAFNNERLTVNKASPTLTTALSSGTITIGGTANDTATLSGVVNSSGLATVVYSYYTNNTCTTGAVTVSTVVVSTAGAVPNSSSVTFNTAGTYYWRAAYNGDGNNNAANSPCTATNNEQLTVTKSSPTIGTVLSAPSITAGQSVFDTSSLNGAGNSTGAGMVTYSYYTNNTCSTGKVTVNTVTVPTSGTIPNSNSVTFGNVGTFYWQAVYSGDANNNAASSPCMATNNEQLTIAMASPTISTALSASSITVGQSTHDTSSLSGAGNSTGAGTVTYSYYTNSTCTTGAVTVNQVTVPTSGAVPVSNTVTFNTAGTYYWRAVYSGDANNNGATSPCTATSNEQLTVNKASPTIATALSASSITVGTTANDTATLTGSGNSSGLATVIYSYYTNNTCTTNQVTVNTVTVSTAGAVPNSSSVTFNTPGTYYWQAVYNGDGNNNGASSPCTAANNEQLVVKYAPTISTHLSAGSIAVGGTANDSSAFTGLVNSTGAGTVTYSYYTNNTCTANAVSLTPVVVPTSGTVPNSSTVTFSNAGTYYWQAVYSGDANNFAASSPCTATNNEQLTINKASPTISTMLSASSITAGGTANDSSAFTGLVNSTGAGTVTYSYYTNNTCTANAVSLTPVVVPTSGTVPNSSTVTFSNAGAFYWQAVYSGDANNNGATSPCTPANNEQLTVNRASPTISTTLSASSITAGGTAHDSSAFAGLVNSTGAGTVTYSYYTNNACTANAVSLTPVVVPASGTVPNSSTVTFSNAGTFYWQAIYSGDANNNGASSPCTATNNEKLTVNPASPTITTTLSAATIKAGQSANDASMLNGAASSTGAATVAYSYYTNSTCTTGKLTVDTVTVPTSGVVPNSNSVTFGSIGTFYWQAAYSGDANNNAATSACSATNNEKLTVTKASPTLSMTGPASGTIGITISATNLSGLLAASSGTSATGTINFKVFGPQKNAPNNCNGGTTVGTGTLVTGNGTYNPTAGFKPNAAGNYWWYASYAGDNNNNGATSTCGTGMSETVVP